MVMAGMLLAGCESGPGLLNGGSSATPQTALNTPPAPTNTQTARFQIAPVIGSPENVSRDLQSQLAAAISRSGATVATAPNASGEYVVRGYVVAAREKSNAKISYIWDVTDQSGKRVHRITGEEVARGGGKDPWAAVGPHVVQAIADKTARQIANWLPGGASGSVPIAANTSPASYSNNMPVQTASNSPSAYTPAASSSPQSMTPTTGSIAAPVTTTVPLVTGAPGDGGQALTTAIQRELQKSGFSLASTPGPNTYRVEGKVAMGNGKDGKQPIQIDWNVLDPSGKKLGSVSQKNEVPQGSLDGTWGRTADAAAAAAAQGIIKLLPQKAVN